LYPLSSIPLNLEFLCLHHQQLLNADTVIIQQLKVILLMKERELRLHNDLFLNHYIVFNFPRIKIHEIGVPDKNGGNYDSVTFTK
jgi:hypothetical protein